MTVNAVVLAGGINSAEMQEATGVENRALTPLGDRTMLDYVTLALKNTSSVGAISVVGKVPASAQYETVAGGETLLDNLLAGINASQAQNPKDRVLVSTSDVPFLTPESVEDFLANALSSGGDLCCSYVPVSLCYAKYPEMKRTAIKVKEGQMTLGNLMLVNPRFLLENQETISRAYAARKSPLQIARMLGGGLLVRLVLAQLVSPSLLSIERLEQSVSRLLGQDAQAKGIASDYPEIGTDIDRPEDVAVARRILGISAPIATR